MSDEAPADGAVDDVTDGPDPIAVLGLAVDDPDSLAADAARAHLARLLGRPAGEDDVRPDDVHPDDVVLDDVHLDDVHLDDVALDDVALDDDLDPDGLGLGDGETDDDPVAELGRLGDRVCWWASVRGTGRPGPPSSVLMVGASPRTTTRRRGARALSLPGGDGTSVREAVSWGIAAADDAADRGVELVVLSLDDPPVARALSADLLGLDAVEASGWPQDRGLPDDAWMAEVTTLRDRLYRLRPLRNRPTEAIASLGPVGAPAAAAVALLMQAGVRRTPVLLDGPGAAAAALVARRVGYQVSQWWQAAQRTADPVHERALGSLGLEALTALDVTLEDGTAALAGLAVLDQAAALLDPAAVA